MSRLALSRLFLAILPVLLPRVSLAQEDKAIEACFSAYEETQVRLKAKEFEKARELARSCSSGCPKEIVSQCQTWAWEAERDSPSVLLVARRENGEDVPGITVSVDGNWKPLKKEVLLDPGPHSIAFSQRNGWEYQVNIEIHPGEKRRTIRALVPEEEKPAAAPVAELPPKKKKGHLPWAIASFSVSTIGFGAAGAFTLVALDQKGTLDDCAPTCTEAEVHKAQNALIVADVGLAVGVVGLATGIGVLVWGKPKKDAPSARIGVAATASSVSTVLRGRF